MYLQSTYTVCYDYSNEVCLKWHTFPLIPISFDFINEMVNMAMMTKSVRTSWVHVKNVVSAANGKIDFAWAHSKVHMTILLSSYPVHHSFNNSWSSPAYKNKHDVHICTEISVRGSFNTFYKFIGITWLIIFFFCLTRNFAMVNEHCWWRQRGRQCMFS